MSRIYFVISMLLFMFVSSVSLGVTYTTTADGVWSPSDPGANYIGADTIIVNHVATLTGFNLQSGGLIQVNSGGDLTANGTVNSGASMLVDLGGIYSLIGLSLNNSGTIVISGRMNSENGYLINASTGSVTLDEGGTWIRFVAFTFTNQGQVTFNEQALWSTGTFLNYPGGTTEINSNIGIGDLTFSNQGALDGLGTITLGTSVNFSSTGSINTCTDGATCVPPITLDNVVYLGATYAEGKTIVKVVDGEVVDATSCGTVIYATEDLLIDSNRLTSGLVVQEGITVTIDDSSTLTICQNIINDGIVHIKNTGSLVETATLDSNSGAGVYMVDRVVANVTGAYNSLSSPFKSVSLVDVFPSTNPCDILAFDETIQAWRYDYPENYQTTCDGNSVTFTAADLLTGGDGIMDPGRGYFVPGHLTQLRTISGDVNNGDIEIGVSTTGLGDYHNADWELDDWNLIGNPYPSGIDLDLFYAENNTKILGGFHYWVDDNSEGDSYHHSADYAVYASGAATNANGKTASRYVPAGQSFWVHAIADGNIKFTNAMRIEGEHKDVYKTIPNEPTYVYLDVVNEFNNFNQCAVGFSSVSTNGFDKASDVTKSDQGADIFLASLGSPEFEIDSVPFIIQTIGKLKISEKKTVALQLITKNEGNHTFNISRWQNIENEIGVYLLDKETGVVTNLRTGSYSLNLQAGNYMSRFVLVFDNTNSEDNTASNGEITGLDNIEGLNEKITITQKNDQIWVQTLNSNNTIQNVIIYDVLGKQLVNTHNEVGNPLVIDVSILKTGAYIVQTSLSSGHKISNKIMLSE